MFFNFIIECWLGHGLKFLQEHNFLCCSFNLEHKLFSNVKDLKLHGHINYHFSSAVTIAKKR